ncbi:MAG: LegC family aminotransferase [Gammaproteobacteria bacterium]|nr:MAG: LegC family aminotransferase [Gammaproteobacteria bacterium]
MAIARQRIRLPQGAWRSAAGSLLGGNLWDGPDIARFEQAFAGYIGAADAITVPSGRGGFRFLFDGLQLEPGSEVICSAFGYPIVPFLVKSLGYRLRFVDCELQTLGMDPQLLENSISPDTAAVIATHLFGIPCQVPAIAAIARANSAALIEDCAHCYGAAVDGRKAGTFGAAGCFSFETSKVINTMGGGMVTASSRELGQRIRDAASGGEQNGVKWLGKRLAKTTFEAAVTNPLLFNLGVYQALRIAPRGQDDRFASGYHGDEVSMAGKMGRYTNYQAGLGLRGMQTVGDIVARRKANAERLIENLRDIVRFQEPAGPEVFANFMLVTALVPNLEPLSQALLRAGVDTKHLYMRDCSRMFEGGEAFPNAARAEREVLHIPAHPHLSIAQIDALSAKIRKVIESL